MFLLQELLKPLTQRSGVWLDDSDFTVKTNLLRSEQCLGGGLGLLALGGTAHLRLGQGHCGDGHAELAFDPCLSILWSGKLSFTAKDI